MGCWYYCRSQTLLTDRGFDRKTLNCTGMHARLLRRSCADAPGEGRSALRSTGTAAAEACLARSCGVEDTARGRANAACGVCEATEQVALAPCLPMRGVAKARRKPAAHEQQEQPLTLFASLLAEQEILVRAANKLGPPPRHSSLNHLLLRRLPERPLLLRRLHATHYHR